MTSIKKRLFLGLLAIIVLTKLIGSVATYFELKEEMDELFDQNMKQIAHAISVHDLTGKSDFIKAGEDDIGQTLKGEEEFLVQIWHNDEIRFSSRPALDFPKQGAGGLVTVTYENEEWRYYGQDAGDGWLVQVSQPLALRHSVIWEIYFEQLIPTLIQLPILMGLVWLVVVYGFIPLKRISESIEERTPGFLERLPEADAPKEVLSMVQAINGLLDRLSTALDAQRRFTADAAHELRTPLTAVRLELDVLKRAESEAEKQQSLRKLYNAADRSTRLVHQLLELARLEPEQASEPIANVSLHRIVHTTVTEMEQLAREKEIDLQIDSLGEPFVEGRPHALAVLISNLVSNAIHYTPHGGKVLVSLRDEDHQSVLSVSDNGPGISEEERARIFDRFYRILDKKQAGVTGAGLGLSIVKSILDSHNASIEILEGLEGKGVSFRVIFPEKY